MFIAGNEPDLMLISETLPKNRSVFVNVSNLMISGYSLYLNFDSNINSSSTLVWTFLFLRKFLLYKFILILQALKIMFGLVLTTRDMINYWLVVYTVVPQQTWMLVNHHFVHYRNNVCKILLTSYYVKTLTWSRMTVYPRNCHIEF